MVQDEKDINEAGDLYTWLIDSPLVMSIVYVICLVVNVIVMVNHYCHKTMAKWMVMITACCSYLFRSQQKVIISCSWIRTLFHHWPNNFYAQLVFIIIGLVLLVSVIDRLCQHLFRRLKANYQKQANSNSMLFMFYLVWCNMCIIIIEPSMLPMFTLNLLLESLVHFILSSPIESNSWLRGASKHRVLLIRFILYTIFAYCGFYQLGNTNSLSTVSVTACFVGLDNYNLPVCTLFMLINMYSSYVFWYLSFYLWVEKQMSNSEHHQLPGSLSLYQSSQRTDVGTLLFWLVLTRLAVFTQSMACSFVLRQHIFLWAVVSPKLLYETVLTLLTLSLATLIYLARLLD